jgi:hypothetical protein
MDCVINVINLLIQNSYAITFVATAMITTTMLKNADTIMNVKRGVIMVGMIVLIVNMVYMAKNLVATYLTAAATTTTTTMLKNADTIMNVKRGA